ncbi:hypothetical protein [Endozoicomonas sp. ONNA1]|uniref:hypothetical protein n=1 Tax=Endozoicomonas sp. ONNA1 TaxID=2828740 RepID=UPI0021493EDE|nr:hypothetical protein [Endozoicomonas sp. ONNA1]
MSFQAFHFCPEACPTGQISLYSKKRKSSQIKITTHWEDIPDLKRQYPALDVISGQRWVKDGSIMTSAGITAGIDMSLSLVSLLHSLELAEKTAKQMDFVWNR